MNKASKLPLVYSCSGASTAAQMANHIAVRLDRLKVAEMSCIAGVGGDVKPLVRIAQSGRGSFLAVLKVFGPANANLLSFPVEGYTLALDFKVETAVFELLDTLDRIVLHHGGRLYLTKDARMSEATFKAAYPRWTEFESVRARWHAHGKFASSQSIRLGLQ